MKILRHLFLVGWAVLFLPFLSSTIPQISFEEAIRNPHGLHNPHLIHDGIVMWADTSGLLAIVTFADMSASWETITLMCEKDMGLTKGDLINVFGVVEFCEDSNQWVITAFSVSKTLSMIRVQEIYSLIPGDRLFFIAKGGSFVRLLLVGSSI